MKPSPSKVAARHLKATPAKGSPSPAMLVDLSTFLVGFRAFHNLILGAGSEGDGVGLPPEAQGHYERGLLLLRKVQGSLPEQITGVLGPLMERPEFARFKPGFLRATRSTLGPGQALDQAEYIGSMFEMLRSRGQVLRDAFPGRSATAAMVLGSAATEESPFPTLNKTAGIIPVGGMQILHKWVEKAASIAGVPTTDIESTMADTGTARQLGKQLREVNQQLALLDPTAEAAVDLQDKRSTLQSQITSIAEAAVQPEVVMGAAMSEATSAGDTLLLTATGKQLGLTPEQEVAMRLTGQGLIAAGAGSGKTRVLAAKVVYTIKELGARPDQIIATSFSKKSAAELKDRILKYGGDGILEDKAAQDGFGTTHSVAGRLMGKYRPRQEMAKIIDSGDQTTLIKMAMAQVQMPAGYGATPQDPDPTASMFPVVGADTAPIDQDPGEGTNETQADMFGRALKAAWEAYKWQEDNYGPAAWRTTTMNLLRSMKGLDPATLSQQEKDAVNRAFGYEVRPGDKPRDMTLKALGRAGLSGYKVAAYGGSAAPAKKGYWNEPANQWFNLNLKLVDEKGRAMGSRRFGTAISKYKGGLVTPAQAWAKDKDFFAAVYGAYEWLKVNEPKFVGRKDHDDTLIDCSAMLIANPKILSAVQARFKHILVDEAQDLNKAQHLMFGLMAGYYDPTTQQPKADKKMTADTYVFIGDDKQAIYEFRGADPNVFIEMSDMVPGGAGFKTELLDTNFRSGKEIVDAANRLMTHNTKQIKMTCQANVSRKGMGSIQSIKVEDHMAGADYAAGQIEAFISGEDAQYSPADFGVALRTNAEATAFALALVTRSIPYRSKVILFNDFSSKAVLYWLKLANAPTDKNVVNEVVLNAYNAPKFNLDAVFNEQLQKLARGQNYLDWLEGGGWKQIYTGVKQDWRNVKNVLPYVEALREVQALGTAGLSPAEIIEGVLHLKGADFKGVRQSMLDTLVKAVEEDGEAMDILAEEAQGGKVSDESVRAAALAPLQPLISILGKNADLGPAMDFIGKLQRANSKLGKKDDPDAGDFKEPAVVIDTVHGWKGLECKRLYVNMPGGVFPHVASMDDEDQLASERRLAYVALTRGEDSVTVLSPSVNHLGRPSGRSQFLDEACIVDVTQLAKSEDEGDKEVQEDLGKTASGRWPVAALEAYLAGDDAYFAKAATLEAVWFGA